MTLYDRVRARDGGDRALAIARLKRSVLAALHEAFTASGTGSQSALARTLHVRRSAVNQVFNGDGNVRISTLAEYLHAMGYEADVHLVPSGEPRSSARAGLGRDSAMFSTSSAVTIQFTSAILLPVAVRAGTEPPADPNPAIPAAPAAIQARPSGPRDWLTTQPMTAPAQPLAAQPLAASSAAKVFVSARSSLSEH